MKAKHFIQAGVFILSSFFFTLNIFACKVLVDLNTFKKTNINSVSTLKCDGVWAILVNSDLSNNEWTGVYKTLGTGWNVSEDNPGSHSDYDRIKTVAGYVNAAMCYNETFVPPIVGATQGIGGTILSGSDIQQQSATHGGSVIVLARSYENDGWSAAVDAALNNPMVSGVVLECYPNRSPLYLDSLRVKDLITACLAKNKNFYFLSPGYLNYTSYMKGYIDLLINEGIDFSDDRIFLVAASYDYIAPFIGGDESVEGVVKYYLSIKARFPAPENTNPRLTITGTQNDGGNLTDNTILYDFEKDSQAWLKGGANIDTVFSSSGGQAIPPFSGNYLWLETNATNHPTDYRATQVSTANLDLSNNELVGAVRTWGGLSADPTGFSLKVKVWGQTDSDTTSATQYIGSDNWTYFSFNASKWPSATNISRIWIGIAYSGTYTSVSNWIGKAAIDQIGLNSLTTGVNSYANNNLGLKQNYPNPFGTSTTISVKLEKTENMRLVILDISGKSIKNLADRSFNPGSFDFTWNGTDDSGKQVPDGIYICRQSTDHAQQTRTLILKR